MVKLQLGPELALPAIDAQTQTFVVYGNRGMGKTNCGVVMVEELARAKLRFSVVDPVGVWYGLRHSADGRGPGVELLLLGGTGGGRGADIPIEPSGGAVVADLVADEAVSTVIDISRRPNGQMWTAGEKIRFVTEYCTRLYQRQGERRRALMQVIDEAGRFVPQSVPKGAEHIAACMGAIEQLVELGRNVGVGVLLITQRSARMNKSVSELAECMVAFRTVGPNSVGAIVDWFGDHVPKDEQRGLIEQLRKLPKGRALVVSPGWLEYEGVADIRKRTTFDSSDTPRAGQERRATGPGAKPDLEKYRARLAETIERAEAQDPKKLQRRVAELEQKLAAAEKAKPTAAKPERVEVPMLSADDRKMLRGAAKQAEGYRSSLERIQQSLQFDTTLIESIIARVDALAAPLASASSAAIRAVQPSPSRGPVAATACPTPKRPEARAALGAIATAAGAHPNGDGPRAGLRRMMIALADRGELNEHKLAVRSQVALSGGSFGTYISKGRTSGWIEGDKHAYRLTPAGLTALGAWEPLPSGVALRNYWAGKFGKSGARRMLDEICAVYPGAIDDQTLSGRCGVALDGGSFGTYLSKLRTLDLVHGKRDALRAADELFD